MLGESLAGHCADPPGLDMYRQRLNAKGEPAFDELGLSLIDCLRGTPSVEEFHQSLVTTFGTFASSNLLTALPKPSTESINTCNLLS